MDSSVASTPTVNGQAKEVSFTIHYSWNRKHKIVFLLQILKAYYTTDKFLLDCQRDRI